MTTRATCKWTTATALLLASSMASLMGGTGCSRDNIEAVNLSNEGDKARATSLDEAISKYEQAAALDKSNHRILWKLATAYQKKEAWDKVASTCAKAEGVAPDHANYFFLHGYAFEQMAAKDPAKWQEAKAPLAQAMKLDPNMGDPYFEMGEVLLHTDDEQGALQHYTKAIEVKPDELPFYGPLADLYIRLGFYQQADQVLREALNFKKEGDKAVFAIYSLMGEVKEINNDISGAIGDFENAKKACGTCNEKGQQIAFFNLGAAYSKAKPPKTNEAIQQLTAFNKTVCKGGAKTRFNDECTQAGEIVKQLGGTL